MADSLYMTRLNAFVREQIREAIGPRKRSGVPTELAKHCGVSKGVVSDYINGQKDVGFETVALMADFFGYVVSVRWSNGKQSADSPVLPRHTSATTFRTSISRKAGAGDGNSETDPWRELAELRALLATVHGQLEQGRRASGDALALIEGTLDHHKDTAAARGKSASRRAARKSH